MMFFDRVFYSMSQVLGRDCIFYDVIYGAALHRFDSNLFVAEPRDYNDRRGAIALREERENIETIHVGEIQIQKDAIGLEFTASAQNTRAAGFFRKLERIPVMIL
jgi:hypothetical protein